MPVETIFFKRYTRLQLAAYTRSLFQLVLVYVRKVTDMICDGLLTQKLVLIT